MKYWSYSGNSGDDCIMARTATGRVVIAKVINGTQAERDARKILMATAPELLEAAKALHALIDKHSGQPPIPKLVTLCRNLDAAIAKAEGK